MNFDNFLEITLPVLLSVGAAILFFSLSYKHRLFRWFDAEQVVINATLSIVGTMLSILIAFAIVVVWGGFNDAKRVVTQEANALADVERMASTFPPYITREIQQTARTYARVVVSEEWESMSKGQGQSERANALFLRLWRLFNAVSYETREKFSDAYSASLSSLNELSRARRLRLLSAQPSVPSTMWVMLVSVSVAVVFLSMNSVAENRHTQLVLISITAGVLSLSYVLINSLDKPYEGVVRVDSTPFYNVYQAINITD